MAHESGQLLLLGARVQGRRVITAARDERSFPYELDSVRAARHFVTAALAMTRGARNQGPVGDGGSAGEVSAGEVSAGEVSAGEVSAGGGGGAREGTAGDDPAAQETREDDTMVEEAVGDETAFYDTVVDDAGIVVTELAANAVLHACSAFTVSVLRSAATVIIRVGDNTPVERDDVALPFEIRQGHGLSVVTQIARRWGVDRTPDGKCVWVELAS